MFELNIKGFKSKQQVEEFVKWYEGQGEQDAAAWFEIRKMDNELDVDFMPVDCVKTYPFDWDKNKLTCFLNIN